MLLFRNLLNSFTVLDRDVKRVVAGFFFLQLLNASLYYLLNFYLAKEGYSDPEIGHFNSFRYLAIMVVAIPLGLLLKKRRIKPFLLVSVVGTPIMSLLIVLAIQSQLDWAISVAMFLWGSFFVCYQVGIFPYALRNGQKKGQSESFALTFATWSSGIFIVGVSNFVFEALLPESVNEARLIVAYAVTGLIGLVFVSGIKKDALPSFKPKDKAERKRDWVLIFRAIFPRFIIAMGAGLTIPYINLFFFKVFGLDFNNFSLMGIGMAVLVTLAHGNSPFLKRKYGYEFAITAVQTISVFILVLMASMQYFNDAAWALVLAVICYIFRQPLMNMAGPLTAELSIRYAGEKNREVVSALSLSVWSGSWFFSSQIFRFLRDYGMDYARIFYLTAILYAFGIFLYYRLIKSLKERTKSGDFSV